jgi:hypothetical protein
MVLLLRELATHKIWKGKETMLEIALEIAKENKERIVKLTPSLGMGIIFDELMDKYDARLGEISIVELDRFRAATIYAYEKVIES